MNRPEGRCPNMNHSRMNVPIQYCPTCGETVNRNAHGSCNNEKHMAQRKLGDAFCIHCGKNLLK
jgi:hypothetical protein